MRVLSQLLLVLAIGTTALSAAPLRLPYTEMVKSAPVEVNGLEFVATIQSKWIGRDTGSVRAIEIQLLITNRSGHDMLFPLFDSFFLEMRDDIGFKVKVGGGRDGTILLPPVLIHAGDTFCLSRKAELWWKVGGKNAMPFDNEYDGKSGALLYWDGTGAEHVFMQLKPGIYTLDFAVSFSDKNLTAQAKKTDGLPVWSGEAKTKDLSFEIIEETN